MNNKVKLLYTEQPNTDLIRQLRVKNIQETMQTAQQDMEIKLINLASPERCVK